MPQRALFGGVVACLVVAFIVSGCGPVERRTATGTVPFAGTVTLDGKPLAGASLMLVPASPGGQALDAGAMTDEAGKFEMKSDTGRAVGALPGEYKVIISRLVKPDGTVVVPTPEKSPMQLMLEDQAKESVPPQYSDVLKTTLKVSIPSGGGTQDFKLESK